MRTDMQSDMTKLVVSFRNFLARLKIDGNVVDNHRSSEENSGNKFYWWLWWNCSTIVARAIEPYSELWHGIPRPTGCGRLLVAPTFWAWHSKQNQPLTTMYELCDWCSVQHPDRNVTNRKWRRHIVVVTPTLLLKDRKWSEKCQTCYFYYLSCTVEFY
jgi:hypothetical protein